MPILIGVEGIEHHCIHPMIDHTILTHPAPSLSRRDKHSLPCYSNTATLLPFLYFPWRDLLAPRPRRLVRRRRGPCPTVRTNRPRHTTTPHPLTRTAPGGIQESRAQGAGER